MHSPLNIKTDFVIPKSARAHVSTVHGSPTSAPKSGGSGGALPAAPAIIRRLITNAARRMALFFQWRGPFGLAVVYTEGSRFKHLQSQPPPNLHGIDIALVGRGRCCIPGCVCVCMCGLRFRKKSGLVISEGWAMCESFLPFG